MPDQVRHDSQASSGRSFQYCESKLFLAHLEYQMNATSPKLHPAVVAPQTTNPPPPTEPQVAPKNDFVELGLDRPVIKPFPLEHRHELDSAMTQMGKSAKVSDPKGKVAHHPVALLEVTGVEGGFSCSVSDRSAKSRSDRGSG
jgi:hypothetical protein